MLYSAFIVDPLIHPVPKLNTNLTIKEFEKKNPSLQWKCSLT